MIARGMPCVVAALLLGGCGFELPFDLSTRARLTAPACEARAALPVDLADQGALWENRGAIQGVEPEAMRLRVLEVGPGNDAPSVDVALSFRSGDGSDDGASDRILLGRTTIALEEGVEVEVAPPAWLGSALLEALRSTGRFTLIVETDAGGAVDALLELSLAGTASVAP